MSLIRWFDLPEIVLAIGLNQQTFKLKTEVSNYFPFPTLKLWKSYLPPQLCLVYMKFSFVLKFVRSLPWRFCKMELMDASQGHSSRLNAALTNSVTVATIDKHHYTHTHTQSPDLPLQKQWLSFHYTMLVPLKKIFFCWFLTCFSVDISCPEPLEPSSHTLRVQSSIRFSIACQMTAWSLPGRAWRNSVMSKDSLESFCLVNWWIKDKIKKKKKKILFVKMNLFEQRYQSQYFHCNMAKMLCLYFCHLIR